MNQSLRLSNTTLECNYCTVEGDFNRITGNCNIVKGNHNYVKGRGNISPEGLGNVLLGNVGKWDLLEIDRDLPLEDRNIIEEGCLFCFRRIRNSLLQPCQHMGYCAACLLEKRPSHCAVCNVKIIYAETFHHTQFVL